MKQKSLHKQLKKGGWVIILLFLVQCQHEVDENFSPLGEMIYPEDNPMTPEKIELGRQLFFDNRLSIDKTISCASCHIPQFAFTDRMIVSRGVGRGRTMRNSPSILNSGYLKTMMFDAEIPTLEKQVTTPIQEHVEMNIPVGDLVERLRNIPKYQKAAKEIFDRDFDAWVLTRSIAAFERSLVSDSSRFDQFMYYNDKSALSASEQNGWKIFSEKLYCTNCHPAPHFTTYIAENNGLYNDYGEDKGRFRIDFDTLDMGKFKIPGLRNIALTAPYMHDGSFGTLDEVIEHYAAGGKEHFNKSKFIQPFDLNANEKKDLKNFLKSLTDTSYMRDFR